jgi:hypothetical protein
MSDRVRVVAPDGQVGDVPAAEVDAATEEGFRVLTPEVEAELERHAKHGGAGGIAKAALAGAARGLTLGTSDLLLTQGAGVDPSTLKDLQEENPTASTVGEIVGSALPLAGQLGLGAKAGKALGSKAAGSLVDDALLASPAGVATAIGEGVERAIIGDVARKTMAQQIASRLVAGTVRGAAEAELYNIGTNLSEAVLGDEKVTAERLLAHSEDAMLIGGGLGFGVTAGGIAARAAAEKARGALDGMADWLKQHAPMADPERLNAMAEATASKVGMEADDVKAIFAGVGTEEGAAMRAKLGPNAQFVSPDERNEIGIQFKKALREARDAVDDAKRQAYDEFRPKEIAALVAKDVDDEMASALAVELRESMAATIEKMRASPDIFSAKGLIAKLDDIAQGFDKRLGAIDSPEALFNLIDDTKRTIDKQSKMWGKAIDPSVRDTVNEVKNLRARFMGALTDEGVWGQAAARQSAFNDAYNRLATAERMLIGENGKVGAFGMKVVKRNGSVALELSDKKINTFLSQTGATRSDAQTQALREYLEAAQSFAREVEASASHVPDAAFDRSAVESLLNKSKEIADDAEKKLALESKVRQAARLDDIGMNMFPRTAAAAMGAVLGGMPGAGMAAGAVHAGAELLAARNNPVALAKTLARVEGFALGPAKQMARALDTIIKKAEPAVERAVKRTVGETSKQVLDDDKDQMEEFRKLQKKIHANVAAGEIHAQQLSEGWSQLRDHAPKTQSALVAKQLEVNRYLQARLPRNPFANASANPAADFWRPSDSELAAFERSHRAATNPMTVVKDAARGMVTPEGVEAFKTLYPGLYEDFKLQLFERASHGIELPYPTAVAMSALFGVTLDATMRPDVLAALQRSHAEQKDQPPGDLPRKPSGKLKSADALATDTQAHAERA